MSHDINSILLVKQVLQLLYGSHVVISGGHSRRIETNHRNQPFKAIAITLQVVASHLQLFKTVIYKLKDGGMRMHIKAFKRRAGLGTDKWVWVISNK